MLESIDIIEDDIRDRNPEVLDVLLRDHTTQKNIFWATCDYAHLGDNFQYHSVIRPELVTGEFGKVIMPRVMKDGNLRQARARDMAEVFTPSWICNAQNNLIDNAWFGREGVFNTEITHSTTTPSWIVNRQPISFPEGKTWRQYVRDMRLEMACGEAPYITSRYDSTTGAIIPVEDRIGLLDRKLRVVTENTETSSQWLKGAQVAYMTTYAFEWQGDSLLLAREAMLYTFIENYAHKFKTSPQNKSIKYIAYIISWNVWQMDGIKGVIPNSCQQRDVTVKTLFGGEETKNISCPGCADENIYTHNGVYCLVKDWSGTDPSTGKKGRKTRFIDLLKGKQR